MSAIGRKMSSVELRLVAPVVVVPLHDEAVATGPRLELERAGARRVLRRVGAGRLEAGLLVDRALVGVVLLERLGACHREVRQRERAEERRGRLRQVDDDRVLVLRLAALVEARRLPVREAPEDRLPVVGRALLLERTLEVVPTVEVEADRFGIEVRAVVELHVLPQVERPRGAGRVGLPARRERWDDLGRALLEGDETLEHLVDRAERLTVGNECAVEGDRIGCGAEDELASFTAAAVRFATSSAARRDKRER